MLVFLLFIGTVVTPSICAVIAPLPPVPPSFKINNFAELAIWESLGISAEDANPLQTKPDFTADVVFRLYTRNTTSDGVVLKPDPATLLKSPMNPNAPTKVFIFGWQNHLRADSVLLLKNAYLTKGDYNFVVVDWSKLSGGLNYPVDRANTVGVANYTAKFLNALADSKICAPKDQHIIGHSLGAHVAGMASGAAKTKPGRCTGLDPAISLYLLATTEGRIDKSVAKLVDIIHTAAGSIGLPSPVGHVDFYPNGGTWPQPDCVGSVDDIDGWFICTGLCSHTLAISFFAYTISHPTTYLGTRCQTHTIVRRRCPKSSDVAVMGEYVAYETPGLYYLEARVDRTLPKPNSTLPTTTQPSVTKTTEHIKQ